MSQPRFCEQCGASLKPGPQVCEQCGRSLASSAPEPATAAPPASASDAPAGEAVVGVIPTVVQTGGLMGSKSKTYNVVVTSQRLIFAYMPKKMMRIRWCKSRIS